MKKAIIYIIMVFMVKAIYGKSLPIDITENGHIIVEAAFNGINGRFILDTGAGINLLTASYSKRLAGITDLQQKYVGFRATGERMDVDMFRLQSFDVSGHKVADPLATIVDVDLGGADGLISLGLFLNEAITIDYKHKKLIFEDERSKSNVKGKHVIPLLVTKNRDMAYTIFVELNINDRKNLCFMIDSGAGENVVHISRNYATHLLLENKDVVREKALQSEFDKGFKSGAVETTLERLYVPNDSQICLEQPRALLIEGLIYDGKTSLNWFGDRITIDMANARLLVEK